MKTQIKLKDGVTIPQPMAKFEWKFGYVDGYCRAADNKCYAIVVTQNGEFEYVAINWIVEHEWR